MEAANESHHRDGNSVSPQIRFYGGAVGAFLPRLRAFEFRLCPQR